jgi:hypothetical protein
MSDSDLTIEFANKKARKHFVDWLGGSGEQGYWIWMDAREYEGREQSPPDPDCVGDITALRFKANNHKNPSVVETTLGRMDT